MRTLRSGSGVKLPGGVRGEPPHHATPPRIKPCAPGLKMGCGVESESPRENRSTAGREPGWNPAPYGGVGHPTPLPEGGAGSPRQAPLNTGALERDTRQKIAMLNADLATTRLRLREAGASERWERLLCGPVEALLDELTGEEPLR